MKPSNRDELVELIGIDALTALEQAGCAVVPVEATEEMCANVNDDVLHADDAADVYAAMLKAGPYARKE